MTNVGKLATSVLHCSVSVRVRDAVRAGPSSAGGGAHHGAGGAGGGQGRGGGNGSCRTIGTLRLPGHGYKQSGLTIPLNDVDPWPWVALGNATGPQMGKGERVAGLFTASGGTE